jgi:hypothetical protein
MAEGEESDSSRVDVCAGQSSHLGGANVMSGRTLLLVLLCLGFPSSACADEAEEKAVAAITKLGGKVERDDNKEGKPVIVVGLSYSTLTDADLKGLAACPQLRQLVLFRCQKVTDAGLKELAACPQLQTLELG